MRVFPPLLRLWLTCALILAALTGYAQQSPPIGVSIQPYQAAFYAQSTATLTVTMQTPAGVSVSFVDTASVAWPSVTVTVPAGAAYGLGYLLTQTKPDGIHALMAPSPSTGNYFYFTTTASLATVPSGTYDSSAGAGNGIISSPPNQLTLNASTVASLFPGINYQIGPGGLTGPSLALSTGGVTLPSNAAALYYGKRVPGLYVKNSTAVPQFYDNVFTAPPVVTDPQNKAWCLDNISQRLSRVPVYEGNLRFIASTTRRNVAATATADTDDGLDDLGFALSGASWDGTSVITSTGAFATYLNYAVPGQDRVYITAGLNTPGSYVVTAVTANTITIAYTGVATAANSSVSSSTGPWATPYRAQYDEENLLSYTNFVNSYGSTANVGQGTVGAITVGNEAVGGTYIFTCVQGGSNAVFTGVDPNGVALPNTLTVGSAYTSQTGGIGFTLSSTTNYAVGDDFQIQVGTSYLFRRGCTWSMWFQGYLTSATSAGATSLPVQAISPHAVAVSTGTQTYPATGLQDAVLNVGGEFTVVSYSSAFASQGSGTITVPALISAHVIDTNVSQCAFLIDANDITIGACGPGVVRPEFTRFEPSIQLSFWNVFPANTTTVTSVSGTTVTVASTAMMKVGDIVTGGTSNLSATIVTVPSSTTFTTASAVAFTATETLTDQNATTIQQYSDTSLSTTGSTYAANILAALRFDKETLPKDDQGVLRKAFSQAEVQDIHAYGSWYNAAGSATAITFQPPFQKAGAYAGQRLQELYQNQGAGIVGADVNCRVDSVAVTGFGMSLTYNPNYTGYEVQGSSGEDRLTIINNCIMSYGNRHAAGNLVQGTFCAKFPTSYNGTVNGGGILVSVANQTGLCTESPDIVGYSGPGRQEFLSLNQRVRFGMYPNSADKLGTIGAGAFGKWYNGAAAGAASISHTGQTEDTPDVFPASTTTLTAGTQGTITVTYPGPAGVGAATAINGYTMVGEGSNREWVVPTSATYPTLTLTPALSHSGSYPVGHYIGLFIAIGTVAEAGQFQAGGNSAANLAPFTDLANCRGFVYEEQDQLRSPENDDIWYKTNYNGTNPLAVAGGFAGQYCVIANSTINAGIVAGYGSGSSSALYLDQGLTSGFGGSNAIYLNCDLVFEAKAPTTNNSAVNRFIGAGGGYLWSMQFVNCRVSMLSPGLTKQQFLRGCGASSYALTSIASTNLSTLYTVVDTEGLKKSGDLVGYSGNTQLNTGTTPLTVFTVINTPMTISTNSATTTVTFTGNIPSWWAVGDSINNLTQNTSATITSLGTNTVTFTANLTVYAGDTLIDGTRYQVSGPAAASTTSVSGGTVYVLAQNMKFLNSIIEASQCFDGNSNPLPNYIAVGNLSTILANNAYFGEGLLTPSDKTNPVWGYSNDLFDVDLFGEVPQGYTPKAGDPLISTNIQPVSGFFGGAPYFLKYDKAYNLRNLTGGSARGPLEYIQ